MTIANHRRPASALSVIGLCLFAAGVGQAQDIAQPTLSSGRDWHLTFASYLWASGVSGTTRTLPPLPPATVDLSFGDSLEALKDLDGGLIATLFARKDRLLLLLDINWISLSPSQTLSFQGQSVTLDAETKTVTLMPAIGYRLHDDGRNVIDVYAGVKLWHMENSASITPAVVTPNALSVDETWVDGVIGGQIRVNFSDRAYFNVLGFLGAGGSKHYADIYGGFGYAVSKKLDAYVGYRVMQVEHENGAFLYDVTQEGPLLGIAAKF